MVSIQAPFRLDLRSLAVFRIGLAISFIVLACIDDAPGLVETAGLWQRWDSLFVISETLEKFGQYLLTPLLSLVGIVLLVGYRAKVVLSIGLFLSGLAYFLNVGSFPELEPLFLPIVFWSWFLPLGANFSFDSAMNTAIPKTFEIVSSATIALALQQCFNYWMPNSSFLAFGTESTSIHSLLLLIFLLAALTLLMPLQSATLRAVLINGFVLLHLLAWLFWGQPIQVAWLAISIWLAFLPTIVWEFLEKRLQTSQREGLVVYYDADCGFCKKVVHVLRAFLILPGTPLLTAQSDDSICADMEAYNSWVVVDWQQRRHFKFEAIAYICSLSPIFRILVPLLRWSPVMSVGTRFYEMIAKNRKQAGLFTRPLKFNAYSTRLSTTENFMVAVLATIYFLIITAKIVSYLAL